jgi:hypothetical protein
MPPDKWFLQEAENSRSQEPGARSQEPGARSQELCILNSDS